MDESVYEQNGYENRQDYLQSLADDHGMDISDVMMIADTLGENEDFDGLVSSLEDYAVMMGL